MPHTRLLIIVVDLIGLGIGAAGAVFCLFRGQFVAALILAGISAGLVILIRRHLPSIYFQYQWLRHELVIHDAAGRRATWRIIACLTPRRRLTRFDDGRLTCSGRFLSAMSSNGDVRLRRHAPGNVAVRTRLRPPMPSGQEVVKDLTLEMEDAYTDTAEHHSWRPRNEMDYLEIWVRFPPDRRPREVRGVRVEKGARRDLYNVSYRENDATVVLRVNRPNSAADYRLEWLW
ncbi:MAG: hypothetical protein JXQ27_04655 [Acidobacteria bacterium]|nr:hypothetical protein [Acidobacteriota bacterium]